MLTPRPRWPEHGTQKISCFNLVPAIRNGSRGPMTLVMTAVARRPNSPTTVSNSGDGVTPSMRRIWKMSSASGDRLISCVLLRTAKMRSSGSSMPIGSGTKIEVRIRLPRERAERPGRLRDALPQARNGKHAAGDEIAIALEGDRFLERHDPVDHHQAARLVHAQPRRVDARERFARDVHHAVLLVARPRFYHRAHWDVSMLGWVQSPDGGFPCRPVSRI
jgi:hypothetical protein